MERELRKSRKRYAAATAATAVFAAIYERFSHQVYSPAMIFAFAWPLLGGLIPYTLLLLAPTRLRPGAVSRCLYDSGIAALTVGSVFRGVLEIYGTTNRLSAVYGAAGTVLVLAGLGLWLLPLAAGRAAEEKTVVSSVDTGRRGGYNSSQKKTEDTP